MPRGDQSPDIDEQSPLIGPEDESLNGDVLERPLSEPLSVDDSTLESKSVWYLILLTLSIGGLQIVWSVELSNGSPYLLSLGMSKALVAFVWVAGPVTGVLVQPYIGILSDRSRNPWGKRKPFMIAGALGTVASSIILSYARDIVRILGGLSVDAHYGGGYKTATIILATVMMWCLDFAINTVQAAIRAFIVDNAPSHQQEAANAWASRMTGIGNVLGYIFGFLNLPEKMHFFGNTQFKVLVVIASIAITSTVLVSILAIKERNPRLDPPSRSENQSGGLLAFFRQVFQSIRRLPPQTRKVCEIQFFHWIGWFPFLFYITTYIGQLYVNPYLKPGLSDDEVQTLWDKATRVGTMALLIYAITSFGSNLLLPLFLIPTYKPNAAGTTEDFHRPLTPTSPIGSRASLDSPTYGRAHRRPSRSWMQGDSMTQGRTLPSIVGSLSILQIPGLTLRRAWLGGQLLFSACCFSTVFITTPTAATIMTALIGISWALTLWAPFALISAEISQRDEKRRRKQRAQLASGEGVDMELEEEDQAGIVLGIHNVAVSAPQILATLICSLVFKALQKPRDEPGDTSVGWCLRIGGAATLIAAFITWRMNEASDEPDEPK